MGCQQFSECSSNHRLQQVVSASLCGIKPRTNAGWNRMPASRQNGLRLQVQARKRLEPMLEHM
jgi:hypothetical protein